MFGTALLPLLAAGIAAIASVDARMMSKAELHAKQAEAAARIRANMPRATSTGVKNVTFSNPRASGTSLNSLARYGINIIPNQGARACPRISMQNST